MPANSPLLYCAIGLTIAPVGDAVDELTRRPTLCPILIGRAAAVGALRRLVEETRLGSGGTVLVAGEAGIGKTRLLAEIKDQVVAHGLRALQGACFPPDRGCPYAPLLDLFRARIDPADDLGPAAGALASLLPELIAPPASPLPPADAELERRRISAAFVQVFLHLAAQQPLLVVIEDIHWSDETSLGILYQLMRRSRGAPLLLALTYRHDEVGPSLGAWLAQVDRARLAHEIVLSSLTGDEVTMMVQAILGESPGLRRERIAELYALSQGNPFAIEELLQAFVASSEAEQSDGQRLRRSFQGLSVPRSVQAAVQERGAGLSAAARQLLQVAAVAGRRFDLAVLQGITGQTEAELLAGIKELIAIQLVVEETADRFAFRHALTRQAVYAELLARERQALHRAVAALLHRQRGASPADQAYHLFEAGAWAEAYEQARQAADLASTLDAPAVVIEQLTRALLAATRLGMTPPASLHRQRGQAYELIGDLAAAQADYETSRRLAEAASDRAGHWQALIDLGGLLTSTDYARAADYFQRALDLARALAEPAMLAESLNRLGNWYANAEQPREALAHHHEALALAQQVGDRRGVAATLDLIGTAQALAGNLVEGLAAVHQAIDLFRALGDRPGLVGSLAVLVAPSATYEFDTLSATGRFADQWPYGEEALALARAIGWRAGEAFVLCMLGESLGAAGEFGRSLAVLNSGLAIAEEIEHPQWQIQAHWALAYLHADRLDLPAARRRLERARIIARLLRSPNWDSQLDGSLAAVLVRQGDVPAAEAVLAGRIDLARPPRTPGQRHLWAARVELALAHGHAPLALDLLAQLVATAASSAGGAEIPRLAILRARALLTLGRADEAVTPLRRALEAAHEQGARPWEWRLHCLLSDIGRILPDRAQMADHLAAARQLAEELALTMPAGDERDRFLRSALADLPAPPGLTARQAAKAAFGGLTTREREIAALIAGGQTSREIAAHLSIGERTVETHVSNMLAKLGATSRAQVAAWAVAHGLVPSDT